MSKANAGIYLLSIYLHVIYWYVLVVVLYYYNSLHQLFCLSTVQIADHPKYTHILTTQHNSLKIFQLTKTIIAYMFQNLYLFWGISSHFKSNLSAIQLIAITAHVEGVK